MRASPPSCSSLWSTTLGAPWRARVAGRLARRAHDDEKLARREDRLEKLLTAAVEHYARALELFDAWKAQRASSKQQVEKALTGEPATGGREAAAEA